MNCWPNWGREGISENGGGKGFNAIMGWKKGDLAYSMPTAGGMMRCALLAALSFLFYTGEISIPAMF